MKSLLQITSKLSIQNTDLHYHYLINDVRLGLDLALKHKRITKNQDAYNLLKMLNEEAKKLPMSIWEEIDLQDQLTAYNIGLDALEIIEEMIGE
ncbi:hypothetical protein [Winogradskyella bathintestinalis]|uniref:Uncharacterized protein n=1 Tax=Winogradskyella bathintestinalis TaxID=3035208 RepID=A0ABT7ZX81_9FLAO|nr:hypothetical protein [Winogradskyella bathintestinalis]MDN3493541.1 hypothetical protein [Winogradskyella bathintestinalis]